MGEKDADETTSIYLMDTEKDRLRRITEQEE